MAIKFHVPAIPVAQPRQRHRVMHYGGRAISQNYTPKNSPVNAYKAAVQLVAQQAYDGPPIDGPVAIDVLFVLPRPKSKTWKTKPMPRAPHTGKPDIDNLYKAFVDALCGLTFTDDSRIFAASISKCIAAGDEQPHCEVTIQELYDARLDINRTERR